MQKAPGCLFHPGTCRIQELEVEESLNMRSRLSSSIEDYLEAILALTETAEAVRITDIASRLGIAKSSVSGAMNVLRDKGLITQEPYGRVFLTPEGLRQARLVREKHTVLRSFLHQVLGVDLETAEQDACRMEHAVGPETMSRLIDYLEKVLPNAPSTFHRK